MGLRWLSAILTIGLSEFPDTLSKWRLHLAIVDSPDGAKVDPERVGVMPELTDSRSHLI
jgi:hypothetical protein